MIEFTLNGETVRSEMAPDTPLLWVLRDDLNATGTKYGCGIAQCGACTVHVDGKATRSCVLPLTAIKGREVTTIEHMAQDAVGSAVQQSWQQLDVVQCGYCQSGQIMSAVALLRDNPSPSDADIDSAMAGNICRCATYQRIRAAIHSAAEDLA
jgi:isoquinoline 1-oxidoreductase alpha subunit